MSALKRCASAFLFLCCATLCFSFTLGDKLKKAEKGDYVVTEQDKNYSLLLIRSSSKESLLLEEISIPCQQMPSSTSWRSWLESGAPGHTSWVMYEIDPETNALIEGYSFTKRGWLYLEDSQHFLGKLLTLPLHKVSKEDRKKIGPSPFGNEPDHRALWNPSLIIEGKKTKAPFEAWKTRWPKDDSLLSSCEIQLYFRGQDDKFAFPHWIEASNGHYTYAIKAVDSGKNLDSPLTHNMPHRAPQLQNIKKTGESVRLTIKTPPYYKNFHVFVFDITRPYENIGPLPFILQKSEEPGTVFLDISFPELEKTLLKGHHYKWVLMPSNSSVIFVESEDFFLWPSLASK